ncbi:MAG: DUF4255 domain-containing protein [Gallionellaceae bacterium]|nr:DUF4255 domain-containing protein [Gallionellaceae bacterium]
MALALSPLSQVCKGIRAYLDGAINAPDRSKVSVVLATPAETASTGAGDSDHYINLFFYRFEPAGLFPDTLPGETGWVRAFCLVTPFAAGEDSVGAGENDLKLVGEVMRVFHEKPVFKLNIDGVDYHVQVIFQPLGLDQLNQLWSTQGDTIYRPSVLYEVSLAPVVPAEPAVPAPLAGGFGLRVQPSLDNLAADVADRLPEVPAMTPDTARPDWTPALAFVHQGACAFSLSFALASPTLAAFVPRVWLAGKAGETVRLHWQTWDAAHGWQSVTPASDAIIATTTLAPDQAASAVTSALALPFADHVGQMLLHAERDYARPGDGAIVTVRSNPLLISLYTG